MLALGDTLLRRQMTQRLIIPILLVLSAVLMVASLTIGGVNISPMDISSILLGQTTTLFKQTIIIDIRLPRIVIGFSVGAGLAVCGAAIQAIFRNPLADPGLIGVSSGAALGAVCMIVLGNTLFSEFLQATGIYAIPISAFVGCLLVFMIIFKLSAFSGQFTVISLLLAGIAVNAIVGSVIGVLTLISSDQQLRDLTFWSMGSLAGNHWSMITPVLFAIIIAVIGILRVSTPLNLYLLGETQAQHLGVNVKHLKIQVFICTALCIGSSVAVTGMIGFVGFVVPHLVRIIIGPDHKYLLPASMLLGGILLTASDIFARTIILPAELPIGLITSTLGGPFFLFMLFSTYKKMAAK